MNKELIIPNNETTSLINKNRAKIIWKQSPDMFFLLFSALMEEGFISTKRHKPDEYQTAKLLYDIFDVPQKTCENKPYTFKTFYQNIKPSSSLQKDNKINKYYKEKFKKLLKSVENNELSLFK